MGAIWPRVLKASALLTTVAGCLALLSAPALANSITQSWQPEGNFGEWSPSGTNCIDYGMSLNATGYSSNSDGSGGVTQPIDSPIPNSSSNSTTAPSLPSGATWTGQSISGTITNDSPSYPGTSSLGVGWTFGCLGAIQGFGYIASGFGSAVSLGPGSSSVNYNYDLHQPWDSEVQSQQYSGWQFPGIYVAPDPFAFNDPQINYGYQTSNDSTTMYYAYTPTGISASNVASGSGTQATVSWNANGNDSGTQYLVRRETLNSGGVVTGWTTVYQGTATSFTTTDQSCGYGYKYRVQATDGPATDWTPTDTSAEWDEFPCSESVSGATTTSVTVSWPQVTPSTVPEIVWCEEGTPAGGVSCNQSRFTLGAGTTSATITGLAPNTEYAVWACSQTNNWGCPEVNVWTYAAVPTLSINNNTNGLGYDQQTFTWTTNGNAPGTMYNLQQGTYSQSGAWQGGSVIYSGTGTSFTANQTAGTSYSYNVWAVNAGYGNATAASNGIPTQVASTPTFTVTGPTTATVSWPAVWAMNTTGVACNIQGSGNWFYPGPATNGATSLQVTGLQVNTQYYCATYAITSNQGIEWWQGQAGGPAYTDANPPSPGSLGAGQSTVTASWGSDGNPNWTTYQYSIVPAGDGPVGGNQDMTTATSVTTGTDSLGASITCGTAYTVEVHAESGSGVWTGWVSDGNITTIPCAPVIIGNDGGLGWSATSGRGYITLSWNPVSGATGYDVWIFDGNTYESFNVGTATSWDSRQALIYPPDASLYPNVTEGSKSPPVFSHNGGGLNLRDLPMDLYCTTGTYYCSTSPAENYWVNVSAYNASGNSGDGWNCNGPNCGWSPTLPLQTDPNAPTITGFKLNNGGPYTYGQTVPFGLSATESLSGIAAYALSNDGVTWTTTNVCTVGQVAACQNDLVTSGNWTLTPNPGGKTVYVKVESTAGVWSAPTTATVYVNYIYTPTGIAATNVRGSSGNAQATVTWNANDPGATFLLQQKTLNNSGLVSGWTTIYQGTAQSFTTANQSCGYGYQYRVQVVGSQPGPSWDTSAEWDEFPCSESLAGATSTSLTVSWNPVTQNTAYRLIWCEESTPDGGVSCNQTWNNGGTGTTSATITGLVPNAEYGVWICSATNEWGCPEINAWTYAAAPTLSINNNTSGLSYGQQAFTWTANGNAPGTYYQFRQTVYNNSGNGSVSFGSSGTGTSVIAPQNGGGNDGGSYSNEVFAQSYGYENSPTAASNTIPTQTSSVATLTATGPTAIKLSWPAVWNMVETNIICQEPAGSSWQTVGQATNGATSFDLTGLQPNTEYTCVTAALATNQGIQWWSGGSSAYTDAATPTKGSLSATQTTVTASWGSNGNPGGTTYQYSIVPAGGGPVGGNQDMTTATSVTTGTDSLGASITCGTAYTVEVQALGGSWTGWVNDGDITTVPCAPVITGKDGGLGWSPTSGRGYITLSWNPVPGATGYDVWLFDGNTYESFNVGTATSWDSRQALIYPPDSSLYPNVAKASVSPPIFTPGGLNLRDLPGDLYCTTGTFYCGGGGGYPENYWINVSAYNASGNSGDGWGCNGPNCAWTPTLPLQTDPNAPTVTSFDINGGAADTYNAQVTLTIDAAESPSGVAAYALSNDGTNWITTTNCTVNQVDACPSTWGGNVPWTLTPGTGQKTVYVKVESTAGVWSAPTTANIESIQDPAHLVVDATLNGGAASTNNTAVTLAVTVTDSGVQSPTFEMRTSTDGGQSWSGWTSEGTGTSWSANIDIPGGASGQRTVLAQVQDQYSNVGQGGASIQYVNPSAAQPGVVQPASLRGFYVMPTNFSGGTPGVAAFVRGVAAAVGAGTGVVYSDPNYPIGWEAATPASVAAALGWPTETATALATWMQNRISAGTAAGSLVVLNQGVVPDTIVQNESSNVLLVQYLRAGGSAVWSGDVPMYYQGLSGGGSNTWGSGGASAVLGIASGTNYWSNGDPYTDTTLGQTVGLEQVPDSARSIAPNQTGVFNLATDSNGGWAAWFEPFSNLTSCVSTAGLPTPVVCTTHSQVTVSLSPPASAVQMRESLDGVDWSPWETATSTLPVNLGSSPGLKTLWVQYQDAAGNVTPASNHNPAYYLYDPGPPTVTASWQGNAAATDSSGNATLQVQATDPAGATGLTLTVTENGATLYQGALQNSVPLTLNGNGYQQAQVTVTDPAGMSATTALGIYVQ